MNLLSILDSELYTDLKVHIYFNTHKKVFLREIQDLFNNILIKPDDNFEY